MNIVINQKKFLPNKHCSLELSLTLGSILIVRGENGIGKSSLSRWIKNHYSTDVTLIEQAPLNHFYDRKLIELKKILIGYSSASLQRSQFERLWNLFRLNLIENHKLKSLSGGENQSLKLALGLSVENKILILDEPSQYLDESRKHVLCEELDQLKDKCFVVVIEHESSWLKNVESKSIKLQMRENILEAQHG